MPTRLDSDITKPSKTAIGDGPADTTDPAELASTRLPRPGDLALVTGTVNAVVPIDRPPVPERDTSNDRYESWVTERPDGTPVRVQRNIDTGEQRVTEMPERGGR